MKKLFVLCAAAIFVVAFTAPSFAAEWSFYGSARISTFWTDVSDERGPNNDDDMDLGHSLQGNSRIGANVKVSDNLVGRFEYGSGPSLRMLYGEYDFGGFKLLVGQTYTPVNIFISNQVYGGDSDLLNSGGVYNGRRAMVRAKFGGFQVALVEPTVSAIVTAADLAAGLGGVAADYGVDTDSTLPMIQAKYVFKVAGLSLQLAGGYQTYDVVGYEVATGLDEEETVSSYIGAIGATYNMGPLFLGANYWMGQNVVNMGNTFQAGSGGAGFDAAAGDVLDNDGYGFIVVAAFTLSDMLRFEAGYGTSSFDLDKSAEKDDTTTYYVQATVNLAKGVFIVPEIGKIDYGDSSSGADQGDDTYYGLKWQINF
jgi:hypothetical protein